MAKKVKGLIDSVFPIVSPLGSLVLKDVEKYQDYQETQRKLEESLEAHQVNDWEEFTTELARYQVSDRTSIMFLSDYETNLIWRDREVAESPIKYIPVSKGVPEGITIVGHMKPGVLYVVDPRDESRYYDVKDINLVLLKDHLLEMKSVFERLGAVQIDISFDRSEEESEDLDSNFNAGAQVSYCGHSGGGKYSSENKYGSRRTKFNQLEIHKKCTGKVTEIDWSKYYWIAEDETFRSEIESVLEGLTKEIHFSECAQSYVRQTSTNMNKIEAEYSYVSKIGVEGMCEWDDAAMSELTQSTVWDVHVVFNEFCEEALDADVQNGEEESLLTVKSHLESASSSTKSVRLTASAKQELKKSKRWHN